MQNLTKRYERREALPQGELLMKAVSEHDLDRTKQLLLEGADPNYIRQKHIVSNSTTRGLFNADGTPEPEYDDGQPTTPLKMVVFCISDCMLHEDDHHVFEMISEALIQAGADVNLAIAYSECRYGMPNFSSNAETLNSFELVLKKIYDARSSNKSLTD